MQKKHIAILLGTGLLAATGLVVGSEREWHDSAQAWWQRNSLDVAPVSNALYEEECGACHLAYQPGLLPARSWERVLANLSDHFGDNAELDPGNARTIRKYLKENAADRSKYKRSEGITRSLAAGDAPLRITETRYFLRKHDELPTRVVSGNPEVGSFANCQACHRQARQGSYNEHQVRIPGYGQWED